MFHKFHFKIGLHQFVVKKIVGYRPFSSTYVRHKNIYRYHKLLTNQIVKHPNHERTLEEELFNLLKGKVSYNCLVSKRNNFVRWAIRDAKLGSVLKKGDTTEAVPLSLKYVYGDGMYDYTEFKDTYRPEEENEEYLKHEQVTDNVNLPYANVQKVEIQSDNEDDFKCTEEIISKYRKELFENTDVDLQSTIDRKWMCDYEVYENDLDDEEQDSEKIIIPQTILGTPDPNVFPSSVNCGGCGAQFHCQNPSVPGYLPKELFLKSSENDLRASVCQRCTFLKLYNVSLAVSVDPENYPKLLSKIKDKNSLVILMVDMTDFPCSIWPHILDVIGRKTPILLVGNKIDLVPGDGPTWLKRAEKVLRKALPTSANILGVKLISAKTGFGVEEVITTIQTKWGTKGDVYLIGCTNVGKSSLFNALIQSDFCRSDSIDLIQRATVSPWPGTTLNLLKFPLLRVSGWRLALRMKRINAMTANLAYEKQIAKLQAVENERKISQLPLIIGTIGLTFRKKPVNLEKVEKEGQFCMPKISTDFLRKDDRVFLDADDKVYRNCNWCYDTPGVVHKDQVIDLLTTDELNVLQSNTVWRPRFFMVRPQNTIFIAGLARLDLIECEDKFVRTVVYTCGRLPITICKTEYAKEVYNTLIGTQFFRIPRGSVARLEKWPQLKCSENFELSGEGHAYCTSEIVLSSAGWVSFAAKIDKKFKVLPWTPEGRGIYFRRDPLLQNTPIQRKKRIAFTPTYYTRSP